MSQANLIDIVAEKMGQSKSSRGEFLHYVNVTGYKIRYHSLSKV